MPVYPGALQRRYYANHRRRQHSLTPSSQSPLAFATPTPDEGRALVASVAIPAIYRVQASLTSCGCAQGTFSAQNAPTGARRIVVSTALPASREHCFTSDVPLVVENRTKRKISDTLSGLSL